MHLVLIILVPAMTGFLALFMNHLSAFSHRASEQTRLDALTLSVCSARADFLASQIMPLNDRLHHIQRSMDLLAVSCERLMQANPFAGPAVCAAIAVQVRTLATVAGGLMNTREALRASFPIQIQQKFKDLKSKNSLPRADLRHSIGPMSDGYRTKPLTFSQHRWQILFIVRWPTVLETVPHFEQVNSFASHHRPERFLAKSTLELNRRATKAGGELETKSQCKVTKHLKPRRLG